MATRGTTPSSFCREFAKTNGIECDIPERGTIRFTFTAPDGTKPRCTFYLPDVLYLPFTKHKRRRLTLVLSYHIESAKRRGYGI